MALNPIKVPQKLPNLMDSLKRPIGAEQQRELTDILQNHGRTLVQLGLAHAIFAVPYSASITPDLSQGAYQKIVVTNNHAITINKPVNIGQIAEWTLIIVNNSGGAMGTVTFGSGIVQSGFSAPANGNRKSAKFVIEGQTSEQVTGWQ